MTFLFNARQRNIIFLSHQAVGKPLELAAALCRCSYCMEHPSVMLTDTSVCLNTPSGKTDLGNTQRENTEHLKLQEKMKFAECYLFLGKPS